MDYEKGFNDWWETSQLKDMNWTEPQLQVVRMAFFKGGQAMFDHIIEHFQMQRRVKDES